MSTPQAADNNSETTEHKVFKTSLYIDQQTYYEISHRAFELSNNPKHKNARVGKVSVSSLICHAIRQYLAKSTQTENDPLR